MSFWWERYHFTRTLALLMKRDNLTAWGLAEKLDDPDVKKIQDLCDGQRPPTVRNILEIAEVFSVSADYLLTGEEAPAKSAKEESPHED